MSSNLPGNGVAANAPAAAGPNAPAANPPAANAPAAAGPNVPAAPPRATLENVLGVVGASGYMKNLGPGIRGLTKSTWRGNNVLLRGANVIEKYPDPRNPDLVVTRLQAAARAGNLQTVLQVLKQLGASNPKARAALVSQILLDEDKRRSPLVLAELGGHEPVVRALFSVKPRPPQYFDCMFLLEGAYGANNLKLVQDLLYRGMDLFPYFQYTFVGEAGWEQTGSYTPSTDEQRFAIKRDVFLDAFKGKNYPLLINFFMMNRELFSQIATTEDTVRGFFGPPQTITRNTTFLEYLALDYTYNSPEEKERLAPLEYLLLMGITSCGNVNSTVRGTTLLSHFLNRYSYNQTIVDTLLQNPLLDVNLKNSDGSTALFYAVRESQENIVNKLLEKGATDVKVNEYHNYTTILQEAISSVARSESTVPLKRNNLEISEELMREFRTKYTKSRRILESLIAHGFDINFASEDRKTPLMRAVEEGSLRLVQYLLTIPGINVNARDHYGRTAAYYLYNAVERGGLLSQNKESIQAILRALVKAGLNLESEDDYNEQTALDYFQEKADAQDYFNPLVEAVRNFKVNEPTGLNTGPLPFGPKEANFKVNESTGLNTGPLPYGPNEANFQGGRKRKTHKRRGKGKAKKSRKTK